MSRSEEESVLHIEQYQLDVEWIRQPRIYLAYAEQLADARREYEEAKLRLDEIDAELDQEIRKTPSRFKLDKVTEGAIKAAMILHPRHKRAESLVIERKHRVDLAQGMVIALEHRKQALEGLVRLHISGYFADPRVKEATAEDADSILNKTKPKGVKRKKPAVNKAVSRRSPNQHDPN